MFVIDLKLVLYNYDSVTTLFPPDEVKSMGPPLPGSVATSLSSRHSPSELLQPHKGFV